MNSRKRIGILGATLALGLAVSGEGAESSKAVETAAGAGAQKFHARELGEAPSPPATLEAVAWLAGHWVGEGLGGVSEEIWSPPAGGAMMGAYRMLKDGRPVFYEFLLIVEEKGSLILKLKHFHPDLTGWEEKADFVDFPLVAVEPKAVHFDGLSFLLEPDGSLTIYLLLHDRKSGAVREEPFRLRRSEFRMN
jgi:hypothetical protein